MLIMGMVPVFSYARFANSPGNTPIKGLDAIVARLPFREDGDLYCQWQHLCGASYNNLKRSIQDEISAGLREDLGDAMPTLVTFMEGMRGVNRSNLYKNKSCFAVGIKAFSSPSWRR